MEEIKFLVLCRGNVVRSPFVAGYLKYLYENSDLASKINLKFGSSGIEGRNNYPAEEFIVQKAKALGFDLSGHRSSHATIKEYEDADVILVTDQHQYLRLQMYMPQLLKKTYHVYEFGHEGAKVFKDIEDPSKFDDIEKYNDTYEMMVEETNRMWKSLENRYERCQQNNTPFTARCFERKVRLHSLRTFGVYKGFRKRMVPICPYCQSRRLKRIKREGFMQRNILSRLKGFPYHCGQCKNNFVLYIGSNAFSGISQKHIKAWQQFVESEKQLMLSEKNLDNME